MNIGGFIGHSGGIFGYNTGVFYLPAKKATIVVILNNCNQVDGRMTEVMKGIGRIVFPKDTSF